MSGGRAREDVGGTERAPLRVARSAFRASAWRVARFARGAFRACGTPSLRLGFWGGRSAGPAQRQARSTPAREPQVVADEASARAELMHFQDGYPVSLEWDYVMELRRRASSVGRRATEGQIPRGRARRVWIDKGEKSARRATEGRVRAV